MIRLPVSPTSRVSDWTGTRTDIPISKETNLLEYPSQKGSTDRFDMLEGQYEYGGRQGVPRLLALFMKYDLKVTWNICACEDY